MANNEQQGREAAQEFRARNGLGGAPIHDLVGVIENCTNFDVAILDAPDDKHGLTMRDPETGHAMIGIARTKHPMRQRSTLAHELAHLIFNDFAAEADSTRSAEEIRADAFARHLLVPLDSLAGFLRAAQGQTEEVALSMVVQHYMVSPAIAAIAMRDAGFIDSDTCRRLKNWTTPKLAMRFGWDEQYKQLSNSSNQRRAPQKLLARLIRGYQLGVVTSKTIAGVKDQPEFEVLKSLEASGIRPEDFSADPDPFDSIPFPDFAGNRGGEN